MASLTALLHPQWGLILILLLSSFQPRLLLDQNFTIQKSEARYYRSTIFFSLSASAKSKITSVSLIHGVKSNTCLGSTQARRSLEFDPNTEVRLDWTWDLTRSGSLPPGSVIWYQWELQDENHNTFLTDPQTYTLEDKTHEWQKLEATGLTLLWVDGDQRFGAQLLQIAKESLQRLAQEAGMESTAPVLLIIYPSTQAMQEVLVNVQDWAGGIAFPEHGVVMIGIQPDQLEWAREVIPHELAHLVTGARIFNCAGSYLPTWLEEGLAEVAAGPAPDNVRSAILAKLADGSLPPLTSLAGGFGSNSALARQAYDQSHLVVEYLIDQYGSAALDQLLQNIRDGMPFDSALREEYGLDTAGLDQAWSASLGFGTPADNEFNKSPTPAVPTTIPTLPLFSPFGSLTPLPTPSATPAPADITTAAPSPPQPATPTPAAAVPAFAGLLPWLLGGFFCTASVLGLILAVVVVILLRRHS